MRTVASRGGGCTTHLDVTLHCVRSAPTQRSRSCRLTPTRQQHYSPTGSSQGGSEHRALRHSRHRVANPHQPTSRERAQYGLAADAFYDGRLHEPAPVPTAHGSRIALLDWTFCLHYHCHYRSLSLLSPVTPTLPSQLLLAHHTPCCLAVTSSALPSILCSSSPLSAFSPRPCFAVSVGLCCSSHCVLRGPVALPLHLPPRSPPPRLSSLPLL